ncbi:MAG: hypothetical protein ABIQ04_04100 [Candidatus Saccharimonadales bacterium]
MNSTRPGVTTSYTLSFRYVTPIPVGSVDMLFCVDPIPYHPCVTPPGLDVSNAVLSAQSGETGFSILSKTANHIVLTRPSSMITADGSSYKFDNIVNPTDTSESFSIRLRSHSTPDATGPQIDFGSVEGQVTTDITLETQVPPMLLFCVAGQVADNCTDTNAINYTDMGQLSAKSTLLAQSQMAVGTNASGGFAITANGDSMSAGTNVIDSSSVPSVSKQGSNQFGINLVANDSPSIGSDPEGDWTNAVPSPDYGIPNQYKYVSGDVVAYSPNVSLMKKFTVSYIVNSSEDLRAGVYSTTITYIASGRF